ncbi:MFS transporter [Brachybacterium hainanense]|uniref:MFS transporter n=1 Tax=Brachybacterium hainanense TaxID=1541174 RepID=A0ABV6RI91_9MICO
MTAPAPRRPSARSRRAEELQGLLVLALCCFIAVSTEVMPIGLLPAIGADLGVGESRAGMLVSLYAALVVLLAVPLTTALHRIDGRSILAVTMLGYLVAGLLSALAPGFATLALARALGGVTHAVFFSVCIGYSARLVPPERTARAMAIVSAGISAGLVLGAPAATAIGSALSWRHASAALAIASGLALVVVLLRLPRVDAAPAAPARSQAAARPALVAVVAANMLVFFGQFMLYTFLAVLLLRAGAAESSISVIQLVLGAVGLLGIMAAAPLLDRRPHATALVLFSVVGAAIALLGLAHGSLAAVLALGVVWNLFYAPAPTLFQSAAVRTGALAPEIAGAWVNTTSNIGIAGGSFAGALLLESSGMTALALGAAGVVLAGAVLIAVRPHAFAVRPAPEDPVEEQAPASVVA